MNLFSRCLCSSFLMMNTFNIYAIDNGDLLPNEHKAHGYVAKIKNLADNSVCSGVYISREYVLTAAHCLVVNPIKESNTFYTESAYVKPYQIKVLTEGDTVINGAVAIAVHKFYGYYAKFSKKGAEYSLDKPFDDIAILKVDANPHIDGSMWQKIDAVPSILQPKQPLVQYGYGLDEINSAHTGKLQSGDVTIVQPFGYTIEIEGYSNIFPNRGDSGGPIFAFANDSNYSKLVAITSNLDLNTTSPKTGFVTQLSWYKPWILEVMNQLYTYPNGSIVLF